MTWTYAATDPAIKRKSVTQAGYLLGYCVGVDIEAGVALVRICERQWDRRPTPIIADGCFVQVNVKGTYVLNELLFLDKKKGPRIYFTVDGWVDQQSRPVAIPWETVAA